MRRFVSLLFLGVSLGAAVPAGAAGAAGAATTVKCSGSPCPTGVQTVATGWDLIVGVAVGSDGTIFAVDKDGVHRLDESGEREDQWATGSSPTAVTVGPDGNVRVAEQSPGQVEIFTPDGDRVSTIATGGTPKSVAVAPDGTTFVGFIESNNTTGHIQVYAPDGTAQKTWTLPAVPNGLSTDPKGVAWTSAWQGSESPEIGNVVGYTAAGVVTGLWRLPATPTPLPYGIAWAPGDIVYVADFANGVVRRYTTGGALTSTFASEGSGTGQLQLPRGLALDNSGGVLVAAGDNDRLVRFPFAIPKTTVGAEQATVDASGAAAIALRCRGGGAPRCAGTLTLADDAGSARFSLRDGSRATVRVKLRKQAREALARHGRLRVKATTVTGGGALPVSRATATVTLVAR